MGAHTLRGESLSGGGFFTKGTEQKKEKEKERAKPRVAKGVPARTQSPRSGKEGRSLDRLKGTPPEGNLQLTVTST